MEQNEKPSEIRNIFFVLTTENWSQDTNMVSICIRMNDINVLIHKNSSKQFVHDFAKKAIEDLTKIIEMNTPKPRLTLAKLLPFKQPESP